MTKNIFFVLLLIISFIGCKNSVDTNQKPFVLNVKVIDSNNNSLQNINVSVWAKINSNNILKRTEQSDSFAATTFKFNIPQNCFGSLKAYDLNNKFVQSLIARELQAGSYSVTWGTNIPDGVFKCKFIASSDSTGSNVYFKDSIYAVLIAPDASISSIGKTNSSGQATTTNKLLCPNLYNLPSIPLTSMVGPEVIGHFTFSDSFTIALSDESFSTVKLYYCNITDCENNITLNWDDGISQSHNNKMIYKNNTFNNILASDTVFLPTEFKLYQNYPNPFD